jgi:diguanylate cyclase (GGDEF)-like protein
VISIRKSLEQLDDYERRFGVALECYLTAINSMEKYAVPVAESLEADYRAQLKKLRKNLREAPVVENFNQCRLALDREMETYCERSSRILAARDKEIKRIIKAVAEATTTLTAHNSLHNTRLTTFTRRLEAIAEIGDLTEVRLQLGREVSELKGYLEASRAKDQAPVDDLRQEIRSFEQRLERAEALASIDRLTGISNRVEGERKLEEIMLSSSPFCLLLFDLDGFKMVNDRWGHQAGDQVLQSFARRLANSVRQQDTVCRWGGDEFLAVLPGCGLQEAMVRAKDLAETCGGEYRIMADGRRVSVSVRVSIGAVERRAGETSDDLFRRADRFLYREKNAITEEAGCCV